MRQAESLRVSLQQKISELEIKLEDANSQLQEKDKEIQSLKAKILTGMTLGAGGSDISAAYQSLLVTHDSLQIKLKETESKLEVKKIKTKSN